ncbi:MAG: hypothetical protein PHD48_06720 [Alphaproteobacteria bacterium]|nr:hypothetical protein [Alphaproteobacteria bacterium]
MRGRSIVLFVVAIWAIVVDKVDASTALIPLPAQQAGYFTNTLNSMFRDDVDIDDTRREGLKWYLGKGFGWPATNRSSLSFDAEGGLVFLNQAEAMHRRGSLNYSVGSASPAFRKSNTNWVGTAYGGGGYFEAEIKFDPGRVNVAGAQGFPSWWMEPIEHMRPPHTQWMEQSEGYAHFVEIDVFEYNTFGKHESNTYSASLHEWYGVYGKTCLPQFCQVTNYNGKTSYNNSIVRMPKNIDLNAYHKYGVLWVPATDGNKGSLQYFFDGNPATSKIEWEKFKDEPPPPGEKPWTFGIMDRLHYVLILGTGIEQPMTVRSVNVWQKSSAENWKQ